MSKAKPIGGLLAGIIKQALEFVQTRINRKMKDGYAQDAINLMFPFGVDVVEILSDDNPENDAQVKQAVFAHVNGPIATLLDKLGLEVVSKVKDENAKQVFAFLEAELIAALRLMTDDEKNNGDQLSAKWEEMLKDPNVHDLLIVNIITPILKKAGADDEWVEFIQKTLRDTLKNLLGVQEKKALMAAAQK